MDHKENAERQVSVDHPALKALMGLPVMLAQLDQLASKETRELREMVVEGDHWDHSVNKDHWEAEEHLDDQETKE